MITGPITAANRTTVMVRLSEADTLQACIEKYQEMCGTDQDGFAAVVKH